MLEKCKKHPILPLEKCKKMGDFILEKCKSLYICRRIQTTCIMVKRKIYNYLQNFLQTDNRALLVTGARQVGKTFAIRKVGKELFKNFVEINFIESHVKAM